MRLLIVDDEQYVVDSLYYYILRQEYLDVEVYKAYSSEEALKLLKSAGFDLIISDISMPELNGFALIEQAQSLWPDIRIVFFTGYDSFDYAYKALKLENVSYILKSEGHAGIIERLQAEIEIVEQRRIEKSMLSAYQNNLISLRISEALLSMLRSEILPASEELGRAMPKAGLAEGEMTLVYGVFSTEFRDLYEAFDRGVIGIINRSHHAHYALSGQTLLAVLKIRPERRLDEGFSNVVLEDTLEQFQEHMKKTAGLEISIVYSEKTVKADHLGEAMRKLRSVMEKKLAQSSTQVLFAVNADSVPSDLWVIRHLRDYISANLDGDLSLLRLSEEVHLNASYLSRLFSTEMGCGLIDYIMNERMERAARLLTETTLKIQDVSVRCGYESPKYMARLFKRRYSLTPTEYRESNR